VLSRQNTVFLSEQCGWVVISNNKCLKRSLLALTLVVRLLPCR